MFFCNKFWKKKFSYEFHFRIFKKKIFFLLNCFEKGLSWSLKIFQLKKNIQVSKDFNSNYNIYIFFKPLFVFNFLVIFQSKQHKKFSWFFWNSYRVLFYFCNIIYKDIYLHFLKQILHKNVYEILKIIKRAHIVQFKFYCPLMACKRLLSME